MQAFSFYIANGFSVERTHAPNFNVYGTNTYRTAESGFSEEKTKSARYDCLEFRTDASTVNTRLCSRLAAVIVAVNRVSASLLPLSPFPPYFLFSSLLSLLIFVSSLSFPPYGIVLFRSRASNPAASGYDVRHVAWGMWHVPCGRDTEGMEA